MEMTIGQVMLWVKTDTKDELTALKQDGETYDELIRRLILLYKNTFQKPPQ